MHVWFELCCQVCSFTMDWQFDIWSILDVQFVTRTLVCSALKCKVQDYFAHHTLHMLVQSNKDENIKSLLYNVAKQHARLLDSFLEWKSSAITKNLTKQLQIFHYIFQDLHHYILGTKSVFCCTKLKVAGESMLCRQNIIRKSASVVWLKICCCCHTSLLFLLTFECQYITSYPEACVRSNLGSQHSLSVVPVVSFSNKTANPSESAINKVILDG